MNTYVKILQANNVQTLEQQINQFLGNTKDSCQDVTLTLDVTGFIAVIIMQKDF